MHERVRDSLLRRWGWAVTTYPKLTLLLCITLAAVSVLATVRSLEFRPDRSDLVDRELEWNKRYAEYKRDFPRWNDMVVCIDGAPGDPAVNALAKHVAESLRAQPKVAAADAGFYVMEASPRVFAIAPRAEFDALIGQLQQARQIAAAENVNAFLAAALSSLAEQQNQPDASDQLRTILTPFVTGLTGGEPSFAFLHADPTQWQPLVSEMGSGRLRFVQVQFAEDVSGVNENARNLQWLRERVKAIIAEQPDIDITWGVTGVPAIEADETAQSMRDSTFASILAFVLITALMLGVFRGITVPLLAAGSLLIGLAWSFGWLIVSVGHLQVLSVVFSVILLGLGVDFALHVVSRLELIAKDHESLTVAIPRVYVGIGPGMITGAVTTAAAFACTALTQFTGMKEMGIIAAGGIILCMIAVLSAFPAALTLTGKWDRIIRSRPGGETAHFAHGRLDFADAKPRRTIVYTFLITSLLGVGASLVHYDSNVLNLHPPGIESVVWERKIVEEASQSVWAALIETSPEEAPRLVDQLRDLPTVSDVGGMGLLFPADRDERAAEIAELRDMHVQPAASAEGMDALTTQLSPIVTALRLRLGGADRQSREALAPLVAELERSINVARIASREERAARWVAINDAFLKARNDLRSWITEALQPRDITPEDLPEVLRSQWIGSDGKWLLKVYPAIDPQGRPILDPARLGKFVWSVRNVAPDALGPPVQIYESSRLIKREYIKASAFAIAAILMLLLLDFRSLADAICAMTPVTLGFLGVFGLMGPLGVPLNFANIIVMPLIFGIGVDAGVHAVHRWRAEPFGRPAGLSGGTGRGITLTMATTIIGFGSMLFAEHRGIRSLAFVMIAGLGVTLLACYTTLPAILRLRTRPDSESAH